MRVGSPRRPIAHPNQPQPHKAHAGKGLQGNRPPGATAGRGPSAAPQHQARPRG